MRLFNLSVIFAGLLLLTVAGSNAQDSAQPTYHVIKKVKLGGNGGWDFLTYDGHNDRLFISRSSHVMVVDVKSGKVTGDIPNTDGVHGIALVPEVGKGFTSDGRDSSVTIFDLKTLKPLGTVRVGSGPDDIFYEESSKRVFTLNGRSQDASAIDPVSGKVVGTIHFDGRPEFAQSDGSGRVLVDLEDKSEIVTLDSRELKVISTWPLAPGERPTGMALDRVHHRLFVGCANNLMVIMDSDNGKIVTTVPIGSGVDAVKFDGERHLVFSSNGRDGTLTIVKADPSDKYTVLTNLPTQLGARTMALDPVSHTIYLITADFGPAPKPSAGHRRRRRSIVPGSFVLLEVGA